MNYPLYSIVTFVYSAFLFLMAVHAIFKLKWTIFYCHVKPLWCLLIYQKINENFVFVR